MTEVLLYGIIGDTFDKLDAATVTTAIRASTGPLSVRINSAGGYVMDGLAIIEALRAYPGTVTIHIDGLAASMASAIAMVGSETIMAESALMMVHKPWDSSIGNADDMRRDAAKLDRVEAQLVGIYAKRTGLPEAEIAAMLAAETWLTPEEALAKGFVTSIAEPLRIAAMAKATGYGFRHIPDRLKQQEGTMPETETDTTSAVATERTRISTILALTAKHSIPATLGQSLIERGLPLNQARAAILDHLATEGDRAGIGHGTFGGQTLDNPATYAEAISGALAAKISGKPATGPATEYQGMSVVDIARDYLVRGGVRDATRMTPDRVINMAMRPSGGAPRSWGLGANGFSTGHTSSDFPDLVGGAAEKYLVDRYKTQESPLKQLGRQRSRDNFLTHYGIQMSGFGALDTVNEAGEFRNKSISSRKEGYRVQTYGNMFAVTRQMLVNDGLAALADILILMAAAAAETEAQILAGLINSNANMSSDGKAWFHADHGNLAAAGAALSIPSLDAGRLAMRQQKDLDGVGLIDANPRFLLVPVTLQTAAETLVASTIAPTTTDQVNPFAGKLTPIADPRLSNSKAWFLFTDPNVIPALEYAYLNGQTAPFTDSEDGWRIDGTEYKVRHDFGAGVVDYRMAWKNPGA